MVDIFIKTMRGSVSIFLVLIMVIMFVLAGLTVDGSRIMAAKSAASGAGDLAMNAALSEYDTLLKDVYGLFAMSATTEELESNISRYFSNTINNTGVLDGGDSYTRSFINSIGDLFSTEEVSFDNIVDTRVESFDLVEVSGSALANPAVLERQIIDYMKYRGPVNMAGGLMTKIGCISETSKQTKVLEAKIDYEKKIYTVQEACEAAYEALNSLNKTIENTKFNEEDYATLISADIDNTYKNYLLMTEYIIAYQSPDLEVVSLSKDKEITERIEDEIKSYTGEEKDSYALTHIKNNIEEFVQLVEKENGEYEAAQTEYYKHLENCLLWENDDSLESQIGYIKDVNKEWFVEVYTYIKLYEKYYEKLTDDEKLLYVKEKEIYQDISDKLSYLREEAKKIKDAWKLKINEYGSSGSGLLYNGWYSSIDDIDSKIEDAKESLSTVLEKIENLEGARENWKDSVEKLSDSDIKTSMEGDYNNSAKEVNEEAVNSLIQTLNNNRSYFSSLLELFEKIEYYNKPICIDSGNSINYLNRFKDVPKEQIISVEMLQDIAVNTMTENYINQDIDNIYPNEFVKITEKQSFYKYLKNTCKRTEGTGGSKAEAAKQRTELISTGNDTESKSADMTGVKDGVIVGDSGIPVQISDAIDALAAGEEAGENLFLVKDVEATANDNTVADAGIDNLANISVLLDGLSDFGETIRDKIYLEEYFTEMFSCYTSGMNLKGEAVEPLAMNNSDLSSNRFYRGEVEYILWGNNEVSSNLNNTKAMIFGIRFALNSIYAFTSSDTRTPAMTAATAIAGWTGFGVPLVQTVILLAWAMAESVVDINSLCEGKAVCIYKSKDTWVLGINGAKDLVKETAATAVSDIFSKIQETAEDSIDDVGAYVEEYVKNTTAGIADSVKSSIMTAVERLALQIIGYNGEELKKEDIADKVDDMLDFMSVSDEEESIVSGAKIAAVKAIKGSSFSVLGDKTPREYMIDHIYEAYLKAKEGIVSEVSEGIDKMIKNVSDAINDNVSEAIGSGGEKLKESVSSVLKNEEELVKEKIVSLIDEYTMGLTESETYGSISAATGLTLTYKEYLKLLILIFMAGNETSMLNRCAKLIQANISQQNPEFDISKALTMVEINADISVNTTFFNVPAISNERETDGNLYDFGNIENRLQQIKYVGILGY